MDEIERQQNTLEIIDKIKNNAEYRNNLWKRYNISIKKEVLTIIMLLALSSIIISFCSSYLQKYVSDHIYIFTIWYFISFCSYLSIFLQVLTSIEYIFLNLQNFYMIKYYLRNFFLDYTNYIVLIFVTIGFFCFNFSNYKAFFQDVLFCLTLFMMFFKILTITIFKTDNEILSDDYDHYLSIMKAINVLSLCIFIISIILQAMFTVHDLIDNVKICIFSCSCSYIIKYINIFIYRFNYIVNAFYCGNIELDECLCGTPKFERNNKLIFFSIIHENFFYKLNKKNIDNKLWTQNIIFTNKNKDSDVVDFNVNTIIETSETSDSSSFLLKHGVTIDFAKHLIKNGYLFTKPFHTCLMNNIKYDFVCWYNDYHNNIKKIIHNSNHICYDVSGIIYKYTCGEPLLIDNVCDKCNII